MWEGIGEYRRGEENRGKVRKQTDVSLQLPTAMLNLQRGR
jgi:hypothetical protein